MSEAVSATEENYLKAIFKICEAADGQRANTNAISAEMDTSAASVTDMLRRLSKKGLIDYERWKGVILSEKGNQLATNLIRKHRLWESFLVDKLRFSWDEVHEIAEQLEHVNSSLLVERLDEFLGRPKFDPHGDPIPDAEGNFTFRKQIALSELHPGETGLIVGVMEHSPTFLRYLDQMQMTLGASIHILERFEFDESVKITIDQARELVISNKVSQNLYVEKRVK